MAEANRAINHKVTFKNDVVFEMTPEATEGVGAVAGSGVTVKEYGNKYRHITVFTLVEATVTLALNGTSTAGGGLKIYDFPEGMILPVGGTADLTVTNAGGDGSFLASLGSAAAGTDGTLTSTEITFAPSTAATVATGTGTCKIKSTVLAPVPGTPLDGATTPIDFYLNAALNANGTGKTALKFSGTIIYIWDFLGDLS